MMMMNITASKGPKACKELLMLSGSQKSITRHGYNNWSSSI